MVLSDRLFFSVLSDRVLLTVLSDRVFFRVSIIRSSLVSWVIGSLTIGSSLGSL